MSDPFVSIILRSYNEGWALRDTLPALQTQDHRNWELIVIDSGSTDGSVEMIRQAAPAHFIQIEHEEYNPSRVMNAGMQLARSEFGIFLNADATPQGAQWLRPLVAGLQDPRVAAVFGKQIPRPNCQAVYAHDYARCFGPNRESTRWNHFFSMVSSGLRKDIWTQRGFMESMQYSEDDEYTRWCRAQGYQIVYVPESAVMHSHNYTPQQAYKRSFGEAKALAAVWNGTANEINFPKTVLLGWANDVRRDLNFCARNRRLNEWPHAARIRWQQRRAKLAGFREGWGFYRKADSNNRWSETPPRPHSLTTRKSGLDGVSPHQEQRFTLDGSDALETQIARICEKVLTVVRSVIPSNKLEALVLGGGYGRGQGGVLKTPDGDAPYNDLEFYVFLSGNRILNDRKYSKSLNESGHRLSAEAGLHVEFKVDSLRRLRQSPVTMFSYDLVSGHRVLSLGVQSSAVDFRTSPVFASCEHHLHAEKIPLAEATRLLFNRSTGLLLAKEFLRKAELTAEEADFVGRNLAKAQLAIGDAVLAASGKYHWSCMERREALDKLVTEGGPAWMAQAQKHHGAGVEFKLHPRQISKSPSEFRAEHEDISRLAMQAWLWLENRRFNYKFSSAQDYALSDVSKCPGTPAWRSLLLNARTFSPGSLFDRMATRYPRERLLNSLPLLLWGEPLNDLRVKRFLQNQLRTTAADWQGFVTAYKTVWPKFS